MNWIAALAFAVGAVPAFQAALNDHRVHRLPDQLVGATAAIAVVGLGLASAIGGDLSRLTAMAAGAGLFCAWWLVTHLVSPALVGFGDVKYTAALGIYLGWFDPWLGITASVLACLFAFPLSLKRIIARDQRSVPLGPYLLVATVVLSAIEWLGVIS